MRTIGEVPHPDYKITVLHHNAKYTLQIEGNMLTQSYKFRESETIRGMDYFNKLLKDSSILNSINTIYKALQDNHKTMMSAEDDSMVFEEII